jgi:Na+-driven multidrug efflux pump
VDDDHVRAGDRLSIGGAATVARRIGEKDSEGAAKSAVQSIILGLLAAVAFGTIGALFGPQMLAVMGASDDVLRTGSTFSRVMLGGSGTVVMLFLINAVFRVRATPPSRCACCGLPTRSTSFSGRA